MIKEPVRYAQALFCALRKKVGKNCAFLRKYTAAIVRSRKVFYNEKKQMFMLKLEGNLSENFYLLGVKCAVSLLKNN